MGRRNLPNQESYKIIQKNKYWRIIRLHAIYFLIVKLLPRVDQVDIQHIDALMAFVNKRQNQYGVSAKNFVIHYNNQKRKQTFLSVVLSTPVPTPGCVYKYVKTTHS